MNRLWMIGSIVLLLLLIGIIIRNIRYRRQIQEVCRQLAFHGKERSNQEIRVSLRSKEILQLQEEINGLFRAQNELLNEYQNADLALKEMITNLSHDIRTPLTSIDGYFQLLCETGEESERQRYREIIQKRIQSLGTILEQLFTYVRIQSSAVQLIPAKCDVRQCLCENLFFFYEDFKKQGIEPQIDIPEETVFAFLDEAQLSRVLQNVLKNALVHGTDFLMVSLAKRQNRILLNIKNRTGEVHPDAPELVFERFFQGDQARNHQSSGLGLCIAKELVEQMQGSIRAYYEEDCFGIEISFLELREDK